MRRRAQPFGPIDEKVFPKELFRKPFRTVTADPGWPYGDKLPGDSRGAVKNYKTMAVDSIARYLESFEMIHDLGGEWPEGVIAKDARLFLWRVAPMQEEALHVMRAWGFGAPVSEVVWAKVDKDDDGVLDKLDPKLRKYVDSGGERGDDHYLKLVIEEARRLSFGMGRTFRMSHETCLVGRRGRPEVLSKSERSVFFAQVREHSQKPEAFFDLVERLSPGPYLELFSGGHRRPGWTCLGDDHRQPA